MQIYFWNIIFQFILKINEFKGWRQYETIISQIYVKRLTCCYLKIQISFRFSFPHILLMKRIHRLLFIKPLVSRMLGFSTPRASIHIIVSWKFSFIVTIFDIGGGTNIIRKNKIWDVKKLGPPSPLKKCLESL